MSKDRILFSLFILVLLVLTYFSLHFFNPKRSAINEAKGLLKEFKAHKAVDILKNAKDKVKKSDTELDAFIFYALVKANEFKEANTYLKKIKVFPYMENNELEDMLTILSENEQNAMLISLIQKLGYAKLNEDFFIKLSSEKNSIEIEMQILDEALKYLRRTKKAAKKKMNGGQVPTGKIEEYLVSRSIDCANIFFAREDYVTAKKYLEKPIELNILENSTLKDRLYYDLAFAYEKLGDSEQAQKYLETSARLGNQEAKDALQGPTPTEG